jgi:hypothetical protein
MRSNRLLVAGLLLAAFLWTGCTGLFHNEPAAPVGGEAAEKSPAEQPVAEKPAETVAARPTERIERLPNGLWVIVRERHLGGMAAFRIYVAAGALNEAEYAGAGISHLLEHLVSGGATPTRTEDQVREALEAIGADTNAQTGKQDVCYFGQTVGPQIEMLIDVVADYVMHVKIDPKSFDREHEVVQRELERGEANPDVVLWTLADETFFLSHPAHFPVIGYAEDLKRLKIEDAQRFYRRVVTPDRSVAVCVGDFDADKVFAKIRDTMGKWERQPGPCCRRATSRWPRATPSARGTWPPSGRSSSGRASSSRIPICTRSTSWRSSWGKGTRRAWWPTSARSAASSSRSRLPASRRRATTAGRSW